MPFKKGESGNREGRPRGAENKATGELRTVIAGVLSKEMTTVKIKALLAKLDPAQRLNYMIKLSEFILPKQQNISIEQQVQAEYSELEKLLINAPDEAITELEKRITNLKQHAK
jgi:hypothetical protein